MTTDLLNGFFNPAILRGQGSLREQALRLAEALSAPAKAIVDVGRKADEDIENKRVVSMLMKDQPGANKYEREYQDARAGKMAMGVGNVNVTKAMARQLANKQFNSQSLREAMYKQNMEAKTPAELHHGSLGYPWIQKQGTKEYFSHLTGAQRDEYLKAALGKELQQKPNYDPGFAPARAPATKDIKMEQKPWVTTTAEHAAAAKELSAKGYSQQEILEFLGPAPGTKKPYVGPSHPDEPSEFASELGNYLNPTYGKVKGPPQNVMGPMPSIIAKQFLLNLQERPGPLSLPVTNLYRAFRESEPRARAAGYGVPAYKGMTRPVEGPGFHMKDIHEGEPGYFFTRLPTVANRYAGLDYGYEKMKPRELMDTLKGYNSPSVLPAWLKMQNPLSVGSRHTPVSYSGDDFDKILRTARRMGHDSVEFKNIEDVGGVSNQYVVFDPANIRSPFAKFRDTTTPDLMGMRVPPTALFEGYITPRHD